MKREKILITGSAGFIGFHVVKALLESGSDIIGLDNLNDYYDLNLKKSRNALLEEYGNFKFYKIDLCDYEELKSLFSKEKIDKICHLAAQPGVRYSILNPFAYQKANNEGFLNILECARNLNVKQFVFASSSSVYGGNKKIPFSVSDRVDNPISLYAATKKSNELVAYVYSHLYGINTIGLRFFTVYGPWGRPDMSYFLFTKAILEDRPIKVFNFGKMKRNFTYIDDVVSGILASLDRKKGHEIFNLGNDKTVDLIDFIYCLEGYLGKKAKKEFLPMQAGDILETWANIDSSREELNYKPQVAIETGLKRFVDWYKEVYSKISSSTGRELSNV